MMSIDSVINKIVRARWSLGAKATKARFGQARASCERLQAAGRWYIILE
jgi:hypothetical protein